jgi:hypothetical protein
VDERLKSIARLLDGEKMAVVCRKILTRDNEIGLEGLTDRSRRPYRHADQLPFQIETRIVRLKQDKPSWGAPKIRNSSLGSIRMCRRQRSARCKRSSTVTACSSAGGDGVTRRAQ